MQMQNRSNVISVIILTGVAVCIRIFASFPNLVETTYTTGFYPIISRLLRLFFGWIPFSIGDIFYLLCIAFILWKCINRIKKTARTNAAWHPAKRTVLHIILLSLSIYIVFNVCWGLNYNRRGIHYQLYFERTQYTAADLVQINHVLLEKVNECKTAVLRQKIYYPSAGRLFDQTSRVFSFASKTYPFLRYTNAAVKPSLFNIAGNYFGFSGYYNPFTGEAQVNTDVPPFLQPYITCHEVAHQLGYAKENEANFAGFIAATASGDSLFMYSAYFDLFMYANRNLYRTDSASAKQIVLRLHPGVQEDIATLKAYYKKYENPAEPIFRWVYGKYLEANDQPLGMITYSEVVADVIAWYKKTGRPGG